MQLNAESETGDLKELSDDEFLHLLKEASTFNKPNNEESILLKQLRKEVADSDTCENVGRGDNASVSKRVDRKCSKISGSSCSESLAHSSGLEKSKSTPLPARTLNQTTRRNSEQDEGSSHVILGVCDGQYVKRSQVSHHIVEIEANNNQWCMKPVKLSDSSEHNSLPLKSLSNSLENKKQQKKETSNIYLPNHFICDFDASSLNQNESKCVGSHHSGGQRKDMNYEDSPSTMVKLESEQASILVVSGCESFMREQIINDRFSISNSSLREPQEIELREIRRSKNCESDGNQKNETSPSDKRQGNSELSNSRFYLNCNDTDTGMSFPLKLMQTTVDERNGGGLICDAMSEQLKRQMNFPCFPWPRAQQVHSFLGALPVDHENLQSQTTVVDYPNATILSEGHPPKFEYHRKHKRTRHGESIPFILSEHIAGHRGNEDIDSLVKFIEASDNDKVFPRSHNANQILKNNSMQDPSKKKIFMKEPKVNQTKNNGNISKKKLNLDDNSNLGDSKTHNLNFECKVQSSESESSDDCFDQKGNRNPSVVNEVSHPCLDINSNVMEAAESFQEAFSDREIVDMDVSEKVDFSSSARSTSPEASGFAADFYAIAEALPLPAEESGFRIVKKKQRKRHQGKRSENYRWHSVAARVRQSTTGDHDYYSKDDGQNADGMMLLSTLPLAQRNQCNKQDSRRKSTSSVPHSEQSSADNSDLDSVHSLPVRGSAPYPTKMHPHTTPSSSSSTPQASYADIARMPVSSISKTPLTAPTNSSTMQVITPERCSLSAEPSVDKSSDPVISQPADGSDSSAIKGPLLPSKSTREINTQTEPLTSLEDGVLPKRDLVPLSSFRASNCVYASDERRNSQCSMCRSRCCTCSKPAPTKQDSLDRLPRPAVVMMGDIPMMEDSDISFGIDIKEILQISAGKNTDLDNSSISHVSLLSDTASSEPQPCDSFCYLDISAVARMNKSSFNDVSSCDCDASEQVSTFCRNLSSPCCELCLPSGQKLRFCDVVADARNFNYSQIVDLFSREWKNVEKEFLSDDNKTDEKVKYYEESC